MSSEDGKITINKFDYNLNDKKEDLQLIGYTSSGWKAHFYLICDKGRDVSISLKSIRGFDGHIKAGALTTYNEATEAIPEGLVIK